MKKVYYSFVLVLMALMSMNVMADTPIKLDVDDAQVQHRTAIPSVGLA